jgi:hypothetical protein
MESTSYVLRKFPHRRIPDRRRFSAINARFGGNGTFDVQPNGRGRPQRVITSQEEVKVFNVISGNPDTIKRRVATREGVLQKRVSRESCTLIFSAMTGTTSSISLPIKKNVLHVVSQKMNLKLCTSVLLFTYQGGRILKAWNH